MTIGSTSRCALTLMAGVALLAITPKLGADVAIEQLVAVPPLPRAVTNNAVVALEAGGVEYLLSFAGLGAGLTHRDTLDEAYLFRSGASVWQPTAPLPGGVGRLAAVAAAAGGKAYVFGGYTVAADGTEVSTPWVHAFDPRTGRYDARRAIPVPVDDAVAVVLEDRYVYLISGWHDLGNVNLVQRYDTHTDTWAQATPIPGPAVFGHSGGIVGRNIVYCDGVAVAPHADRRRDFRAVNECFLGVIDTADSRRIDWRVLPPHPGQPRYRAAAAGTPFGVLFVGGSTNPYNYNGIGYDSRPSSPEPGAVLFDVERLEWRTPAMTGPIVRTGDPSLRGTEVLRDFSRAGDTATMDHRGLVRFGDDWLTLGGMLEGQRVTDRVVTYRVGDLRGSQ